MHATYKAWLKIENMKNVLNNKNVLNMKNVLNNKNVLNKNWFGLKLAYPK